MERGAALVIAVLVTVILALLGISFLFVAEAENRIARNEKRADQLLFVAEAGVHAVKRWFDAPRKALEFPPAAAVDRSRRIILDETDPHDLARGLPADGVLGSLPFYKQQVDRDGDGADDLFERPYGSDLLHALRGTEAGPDMLIDDRDPAARAFLDRFSRALVSGAPDEPGDLRARIRRIAVFAPPYVRTAEGFRRAGMGTVQIVAGLHHGVAGRWVGERRLRVALAEVPYRGPYGPLHSCGPLSLVADPFPAHWGAVTAPLDAKLPGLAVLPTSLPRDPAAHARHDLLWDTGDPSGFDAAYKRPVEEGSRLLPDPWLRILVGGAVRAPAVPAAPQPFRPSIPPPPPPDCCDHSNLFQHAPDPGCPRYDYETWKSIASSGYRDVRYFVWTGAGFSENGVGATGSFQSLTHGAEGLFFFDTVDRRAPRDDDGDGLPDNLTPAIRLGGDWSFRGFIYLNARSLQFRNVLGTPVSMRPPGEPFLDLDRDGSHDAGEPWIDLDYGSISSPGAPVRTTRDGSPRETRGPALAGQASMQGILYTRGTLLATGGGTVYGSLIAASGVVQAVDDGSAPSPAFYWDASIGGEWPPAGWDLPRVTVVGWTSEP